MKNPKQLITDIKSFSRKVKRFNENRQTKGGLYKTPEFEIGELSTRKDLTNAKRRFETRQKLHKFNQEKEKIVEKSYKLALLRPDRVVGFELNIVPKTPKQIPAVKRAMKIWETALKEMNKPFSERKVKKNRWELAEKATRKISDLLVKEKMISPEKLLFKKQPDLKRAKEKLENINKGKTSKKQIEAFAKLTNTSKRSNLFFLSMGAKRSTYGYEKIDILPKMLKHGGYRESYHYNMISAAEAGNLDNFVEFLREAGPLMSYYLYLNGFTIPDFYTLIQLGHSKAEILQFIYYGLQDALGASDKWRSAYFDDQITDYMNVLKADIQNEV